MDEVEYHPGLQETLLVFAHQVVLHLYAGRHLVFLAPVTRADHALTHHVVGVVGVYTLLGVLQLACKIHVVHRDLRQGEFPVMAVDVRHLLVHERGISHERMVDEQLVVRFVQHVVDGAFAQFLRVAVLVGEVVEYLAGAQVPCLALAADKSDVHLVHVAVVGLVLLCGKAQDKPFSLVIHLPRTLVAELAADEALVTVLLVLVHFLAEAEGAGRQVVPELFAQRLNGRRHHIPVVFLAHQLAVIAAAVVQPDAGVQHRGVHGILPGKPVGGLVAVLTSCPVHEIGHGSLVKLVIRQYPAAEQDGIAAGMFLLNLIQIRGR